MQAVLFSVKETELPNSAQRHGSSSKGRDRDPSLKNKTKQQPRYNPNFCSWSYSSDTPVVYMQN